MKWNEKYKKIDQVTKIKFYFYIFPFYFKQRSSIFNPFSVNIKLNKQLELSNKCLFDFEKKGVQVYFLKLSIKK